MARVLIMEADVQIGEIYRYYFKQGGHEVAVCHKSETAVEKFRQALAQQPFDLAMLDLSTRDDIGGLEVFRRLREWDPAIRVVAIAGGYYQPSSQDIAGAGFLEIINKPCLREPILELMEKHL